MCYLSTFRCIVGTVLCVAFALEPRACADDPKPASTQIAPSARECVVLVHGLLRRKSSMGAIETALVARGFDVVNWDYLSTQQTISESADALFEVYDLNARRHPKVHFVTHSLGGIIVRCMLKNHATPSLGKIAMLAPPNQGSALARVLIKGPLKWAAGPPGQELQSKEYLDRLCIVPKADVLIIAGTKSFSVENPASYVSRDALEKPNDGTVSVKETCLDGLPEPLQIEDSHTGLPGNPEAIKAVLDFLQDPAVQHSQEAALKNGLDALSKDPARIKAVLGAVPSMPNVRMKTFGGKMFWADLANVGGWRVQENILFGNCRLLDPKSVRQAWGKKEDMIKAFEAVSATGTP